MGDPNIVLLVCVGSESSQSQPGFTDKRKIFISYKSYNNFPSLFCIPDSNYSYEILSIESFYNGSTQTIQTPLETQKTLKFKNIIKVEMKIIPDGGGLAELEQYRLDENTNN